MRSVWVDILIYLSMCISRSTTWEVVDLMVHPHSLNYGLELMNKEIDFNAMNASYSCPSFILLFREGKHAIDSWNYTQTKKTVKSLDHKLIKT